MSIHNTKRRIRPRRRTRSDAQSTDAVKYPAYFKRKIASYDLLSEERLDEIERHAEWILSDIGVIIQDDEEIQTIILNSAAII